MPSGWTMTELLVVVAIIVVLAGIAVPIMSSMKQRAYRAHAISKLEALGGALTSYTSDNAGALPWEDAPGSDDWQAAAQPENKDVWYNVLPELIGYESLGALASSPDRLYEESYPLYLPGAPYPSGDKKLGTPYFAIAMNSRLQRKNDEGIKLQGRLSQIQVPSRTVAFFEAGMPGDKKTVPGQRGFDASPKGNARAFVGRYNGKGMLVFVDGHVEPFAPSDLITTSGDIKVPQNAVVWTNDPDEDPN
ncbi:prepilin-type N-terminal cleavage/methylation domain-containing protein [Haloferula chungangensis]|uniref:Prepilin-type N-terminal cleavage/methylation domain-containing protein n=1 Tax=Haloferula chungangensis TaxID=1048331 RepID=A0ABW2L4M3_9BACT